MKLLDVCGCLAAVLALTGCAGVRYEQVYKDGESVKDAASPPGGAFAFSLHTTIVTLTAPASGASAKPGVPIPCTDKNSKPLSTPLCLLGVTETAAPAGDRTAAYFAEPLSTAAFLGGTQLAPRVDATDVLLLSSVTFSYNNKVPGILTATGTGAAAGFVFGPWGAVVGGAIGLASGIGPQQRVPEIAVSPRDQVCPDALDLAAYDQAVRASAKTPIQIALPVALHYQSVTSPDNGCWYAFPLPLGVVGADSQNLGWFYRIIPEEKPAAVTQIMPPVLFKEDLAKVSTVTGANLADLEQFPFLPTSYYFSESNRKLAEHSFPASACVAVYVQVVWWSDIGSKDASLIASTAVDVADPTIVQVLHWSSGGSVTMLPCGAYASTGMPSTALMDDVSSLVKQTQAIQAAQQQWKKLNPPPKP